MKVLNNKKLSKIKNSQKVGSYKILFKKKFPFRELEIKKADEETLGKLFHIL